MITRHVINENDTPLERARGGGGAVAVAVAVRTQDGHR